MGYTIAVINQKGGVAKTTTALALGAGLALRGRSVLLVDLDPQGNLSKTAGAVLTGPTVLEVLTRKATAQEAIQAAPGGPIIAAAPTLGAEGILTHTGKEYRLKEALKDVKRRFSAIVVDCPPSLGVLSVNALTAADTCIIPAQADGYSLDALEQFRDTFQAVKEYTNPALTIMGVLLTRYSPRAVLSREAADMIEDKAKELGTVLFSSRIRECIAVKEAAILQRSLYEYAPKSNAAKDYAAFIEEVLTYAQKDL